MATPTQTTLTLTLDLFVGRWNGAAGELWACLLPHANSVHDFVPGSASDANFTYQMAPTNPDATTKYVPVPFPDDTILSITLLDGHQQPVIGPIAIRRDQRMLIAPDKIEALRDANQDPSEPIDSPPLTPGPNPTVPAPYAWQFNDGLRHAYNTTDPAQKLSDDQLEQHLQTLFWGGTRRRFTDDLITAYADAGFMRIDAPTSANDKRIVTNLHSMLGLMMRLGTRGDLASLNRVAGIRLEINGAVVGTPRAPMLLTDPWIGSFFSKLSADVAVEPDAVSWNTALAKRRWVRRARVPFMAGTGVAFGLFRRRAEDAAEANLTLDRLARLTMTCPAPASTQPITLSLYRTVTVQLTPYRASPRRDANQQKLLYRMTATGASADALKSLAPAFDTTAIAGATVVATLATGATVSPFEWVGAYRFPWDGTDDTSEMPTLLWRGPPIQGGIALLRCGAGARGAAIAITLTSNTGVANARTQRWLWTRPVSPAAPMPAVAFDAFAPTADSLSQSVFTGEFDGDYDFELAQSVSKLEDTVTVTLNTFVMPSPQNFGPVDAATEDRVNYNALNVFVDDKEINPYSELYPAPQVSPPVDHSASYAFGLRYRMPVLEPDQADTTTPIASFFQTLYGRLGGARTVAGEIEHTYGVGLRLAASNTHKLWADFPVQSAAAVLESDPTKDPNPLHFLTANYYRAARDGSEHLVLQFDASLLRNGASASRDPHQMAAWRAVAELANAETIAVEVQGRRFDLYQAMQNLAKTGNATPSAGLPALPAVAPDEAARLDGLLRTLAAGWLVTPPQSIDPIDIMLRRGAPWLWQQYDAIAFLLVITRADAIVPPAGGWQDVMFDTNASASPAPVPTDPSASSGRWQASLAMSRRPLATPPDTTNAPLTQVLRSLINSNDGSPALGADDGLAWLSPTESSATGTPTVLPPAAPGNIAAALCPFGFVPVSIETPLADIADQQLRNFCRLLQRVLTLQISGLPDWDLNAKLRPFLHTLEGRVATGPIAGFVTKLLGLAKAMPNVDPTSKVTADVQSAARAIDAALSRFDSDLAQWFRRQLWTDLSLFAESKGFLALVIAGATPVPSDFYDVAAEISIPETNATDTQTASWPDFLAIDDAAGKRLATIWMLNEPHYADYFSITGFDIHRFDDFAARLAKPISGEVTVTPLIPTTLDAPGGPIISGSGAPRAQPIFLASRQPLLPPVHLFTGIIPDLQRGLPTNFVPGTQFSFDALKRGAFAGPSGSGGTANLVACSAPLARDGMPADAYVLSAIYMISASDEPTGTGAKPIDGFNNDEFFAALLSIPVPTQTPVPAWPNADVANLFEQLAKSPSPADLTDPMSLLTDAALAAVPALVENVEPGQPPPAGAPKVTIQPEPAKISVSPGVAGDPTSNAEAFLFNVAGASSAVQNAFVLLVDRIVSVWDRQALAVWQTRNEQTAHAPEQDFAPAFGESAAASSTQLFQPTLFLNAADILRRQMRDPTATPPPLTMPRSIDTPDALVGQLVKAGLLDSNGERWRTSDIAITVHHEQQTALPGQFPNPFQLGTQSTSVPRPTSLFPLVAFRAAAGINSDWIRQCAFFPTPIIAFSVDFQWSSATNLQFFRLATVRIAVTD